MKPSELNNHDFGQEIGRIYNDCRSFESAGLAIRAYLELETSQPSELEALRAEASLTAAIVQALSTAMSGDLMMVATKEQTSAVWADVVREAATLMRLRKRQVEIDPIFNNPQPTQETTT
jgi:hypothetical protein